MFNLAADLTSDLDAMAEDAMTLFVACSVTVCNAREKAFNMAWERAERRGEDTPLPCKRRGLWA